MPRAALRIEVTKRDRKELKKLLSGGVQQVRVVLRAMALLQIAKGVSARRIAGVVAATLLDDSQKQRIVAMVCSDPPRGLRPVDRTAGGRGSRAAATCAGDVRAALRSQSLRLRPGDRLSSRRIARREHGDNCGLRRAKWERLAHHADQPG